MSEESEAIKCVGFDGEKECIELATWMRHTQFAGNHPYCTTHAKEEENFGKSDSSYFYWAELAKPGGDEKERSTRWPEH